MTTNKTVNQVLTANKSLSSQIKVTSDSSGICIQGTPDSFRMLAEILLATVGGGGNTVAQGYKAQFVKSASSGFMLTPDSVEKIIFDCSGDRFPKVTETFQS